jgi:hypothetical protein
VERVRSGAGRRGRGLAGDRVTAWTSMWRGSTPSARRRCSRVVGVWRSGSAVASNRLIAGAQWRRKRSGSSGAGSGGGRSNWRVRVSSGDGAAVWRPWSSRKWARSGRVKRSSRRRCAGGAVSGQGRRAGSPSRPIGSMAVAGRRVVGSPADSTRTPVQWRHSHSRRVAGRAGFCGGGRGGGARRRRSCRGRAGVRRICGWAARRSSRVASSSSTGWRSSAAQVRKLQAVPSWLRAVSGRCGAMRWRARRAVRLGVNSTIVAAGTLRRTWGSRRSVRASMRPGRRRRGGRAGPRTGRRARRGRRGSGG